MRNLTSTRYFKFGMSMRSQSSDVVIFSMRRFFCVFGLRRPSTGPGTVEKRFRMKNRSRGRSLDVRWADFVKKHDVVGLG